MRRRFATILAAVFAGHACGRCGGDDDPVCTPCDPVMLLNQESDRLAAGELLALPSITQSTCAGQEVDPEIADAWLAQECWELTAHYMVRSLRWDVTADETYRRQANKSFACPTKDRLTGCASAPQGYDVVGPAELELEAQSPIAMLITSTQLAQADESVLAHDLSTTIDAALAGSNCDGAAWVSGVSCTAFLVGPRHVLTARHCLGETPNSCGGTASDRLSHKSLVFDYLEHPNRDTTIVTGMTVVACGTEDGAATTADRHDWALLELDAPAPGTRTPLALPPAEASPAVCDLVYVIGHPLGHPQHRNGSIEPDEPSAWIRPGNEPGLIPTTLDVIHGLSGAPVFALGGDRLVGLLVRGKFANSTSGCDWIFECSSVGCPDDWDYGRAVDLAAIADQLAPHLP